MLKSGKIVIIIFLITATPWDTHDFCDTGKSVQLKTCIGSSSLYTNSDLWIVRWSKLFTLTSQGITFITHVVQNFLDLFENSCCSKSRSSRSHCNNFSDTLGYPKIRIERKLLEVFLYFLLIFGHLLMIFSKWKKVEEYIGILK